MVASIERRNPRAPRAARFQPAKKLGAIELPDDKSEGPHFFYGLQWWFFGALAIFGFGYLAYDEWRRAHEERNDAEESAVSSSD